VATLHTTGVGNITDIAFSPDGRTVAAGTNEGAGSGKVVLWDRASGKEIARLKGHQGYILGVAFTPDGRRLITTSTDTTALVWDVAALCRLPEVPHPRLAANDLDRLWIDLTGAGTARAWRAVWRLAAAPQAVPLMRRHLRPAPAPDEAAVTRLLADLGGDRFEKRSRASRELEAVGEAAAPLLRRALQGDAPLETRRRIEQILERWHDGTPAQRTAVRATAVLEQVGTPEARRLLQELARGAPAAMLTRQAAAALGRLGKRPNTGAP
jgi:hypothetical protein